MSQYTDEIERLNKKNQEEYEKEEQRRANLTAEEELAEYKAQQREQMISLGYPLPHKTPQQFLEEIRKEKGVRP